MYSVSGIHNVCYCTFEATSKKGPHPSRTVPLGLYSSYAEPEPFELEVTSSSHDGYKNPFGVKPPVTSPLQHRQWRLYARYFDLVAELV